MDRGFFQQFSDTPKSDKDIKQDCIKPWHYKNKHSGIIQFIKCGLLSGCEGLVPSSSGSALIACVREASPCLSADVLT